MLPTSPKSPDSLIPGYGPIGIHGAVVPLGAIRNSHLGLESHLDHICGLGKHHSHRPRCAAGQKPNHDV